MCLLPTLKSQNVLFCVLLLFISLSPFTSKFLKCTFPYFCRKFYKDKSFHCQRYAHCFWFLHGNVSVSCISPILNWSDCLIFLAILLNIICLLYFALQFSSLLLREIFHFLSCWFLESLIFLCKCQKRHVWVCSLIVMLLIANPVGGQLVGSAHILSLYPTFAYLCCRKYAAFLYGRVAIIYH